MDDIVRVAGFCKKTPLLQFIQKGKGVTSITGEKLYESQVLQAIGASCNEQGIELPFFIMLADREKAGYEVYLESDQVNEKFAGTLDRELAGINLEYDAKRKSGRLAPIALFVLKTGTGEAYKHHMIQCGQREGQYKPVLLQYKDTFGFALEDYVSR